MNYSELLASVFFQLYEISRKKKRSVTVRLIYSILEIENAMGNIYIFLQNFINTCFALCDCTFEKLKYSLLSHVQEFLCVLTKTTKTKQTTQKNPAEKPKPKNHQTTQN